MGAQGMTIPLVLSGETIGHVSVVQDLEGGISISGGSFRRVDMSSSEFLNLSHMEFCFRHADPFAVPTKPKEA
jgi:hypothetical protein